MTLKEKYESLRLLYDHVKADNDWMKSTIGDAFNRSQDLKLLSDLIGQYGTVENIIDNIKSVLEEAHKRGYQKGWAQSKFDTPIATQTNKSRSKSKTQPKTQSTELCVVNKRFYDVEKILKEKYSITNKHEEGSPIGHKVWLSGFLNINIRSTKAVWEKSKKEMLIKLHPDKTRTDYYTPLYQEVTESYNLLVKSGTLKSKKER